MGNVKDMKNYKPKKVNLQKLLNYLKRKNGSNNKNK